MHRFTNKLIHAKQFWQAHERPFCTRDFRFFTSLKREEFLWQASVKISNLSSMLLSNGEPTFILDIRDVTGLVYRMRFNIITCNYRKTRLSKTSPDISFLYQNENRRKSNLSCISYYVKQNCHGKILRCQNNARKGGEARASGTPNNSPMGNKGHVRFLVCMQTTYYFYTSNALHIMKTESWHHFSIYGQKSWQPRIP